MTPVGNHRTGRFTPDTTSVNPTVSRIASSDSKQMLIIAPGGATGDKILLRCTRFVLSICSRFMPITADQSYLSEEIPGCSHEKTKSVMPGNTLVRRPIRGAKPNPTILIQNSAPNSPGLVLVTWLNVASRCISAYTFTITTPTIT